MIGFFLTFSFMIAEVIGGIMSGSLALIADAGHMFTDAFALALAWLGFYFGKKKSDKLRTFGYLRFEVLAGFINAVALLVLILWIGYEAINRIFNPPEISTLPMFIIAILGLIVNCAVLFVLNRGDKDHVNIKGALLHVIGDLLGSVAVIAAAIIIYFTGGTIADPILSIFVALLILRSTWALLKNTLHILMQGTPSEIDIDIIEKEIKQHIQGMKNVSHIHIWTLTSGKYIATLEVDIEEKEDMIKVSEAIKKLMSDSFGISHTTVGFSCKGDCAF